MLRTPLRDRLAASAFLAVLFVLSASTQASDAVAERVESYLGRCAAFGWSGVVLVQRGEKVVLHRGFGFADREAQREHAEGALFEIASATKPFTACAILALAEEERLDLDDEIGKHLPGVPEDKSAITIRQLLAHTSGMPRRATDGRGSDLGRAVADYLAPPLVRAPGEGYEYWNGGYALLAGIVERASGQSFQGYCRKRLFERAGLEHTGFTGDEHLPAERLAIGYRDGQRLRSATGHPYGDYGYQYRGMGGIVTSADQLVSFSEALDAGRILSAESVEAMQASVTGAYGLGWGVTRTKRGTRRIGHGGDVAGFHTQWQRFPDEDVHIVVLSNVDGIPLYKLAWNLEALLFDERLPYPAPPEAAPASERELDALAGRYELGDGNALIVTRAGERLMVQVGDVDPETLAADRTVPPELAEHAKLARGVLQSVRDVDAAAIEKVMGPRIPGSWPYVLTRTVWPEQVKRWGELERVVTLGVDDFGDGAYGVRFRLEHVRAKRPLRITMRGGKLVGLDLAGPLDRFGGTYVRVADGSFTCFDWDAPLVCTLRFEAQGGRPVSVVARGSGARSQTLTRAR
ncbi:MAG: beta-lactamase family protein [bacterium]|nr:beta-lactamase family protein [bacterium]